MSDLGERTRGLLRHADWLRALEEFADEGHRLAPKLARAQEPRLREIAEHIRRAADFAAMASVEVEFADRMLLGGE
jgi:hypothetical protein